MLEPASSNFINGSGLAWLAFDGTPFATVIDMTLDEKRVDRRIEARVKTEGMLSVTLRVGDQVAEGHLVDISTRGAYIATAATLDRGIYVTLVFELGPKGAQEIKAQVARSKPGLDGQFDSMPSGLGVMFLANELEERLRVERLVAALVSLDLLSHDKRQSEWMNITDSITGDDRTDPSNTDTRPGA